MSLTGKSTVVKAISGVQTVRFKNELERNITIKLGYANAKIFKCSNEACPRPGCYKSAKSSQEEGFACERLNCLGKMKLLRHVSFVDSAVMDAALLLIAGNETCPQPQTSEHLAAIQIMKLKNILILQNKVDLIKESAALEQHEQILKFIKGTVADGCTYAINEYIVKRIPVPVRDFSSDPKLIVIRSFDVNKPGAEVASLKGGVAGGSILCGVLKVGDEIEVRPGLVTKDADGKVKCRPIYSRIISLLAESNELKFAVPGGLIGVGTKIDPTICRAGSSCWTSSGSFNFFLLRQLLGVKTSSDGKKQTKVEKLAKNEVLLANIGSTSCGCRVLSVKGDLAKIQLTTPACTEVDEKVALSRRIDKHWRLIGWGKITRGTTIDPDV
ncbi:hypothetical protein BDR26DRAFT_910720 [Obelidium mucronatum]|nr:hypothetical protein BDR26DRAFT_910720 [Obelidium mucronatum]